MDNHAANYSGLQLSGDAVCMASLYVLGVPLQYVDMWQAPLFQLFVTLCGSGSSTESYAVLGARSDMAVS